MTYIETYSEENEALHLACKRTWPPNWRFTLSHSCWIHPRKLRWQWNITISNMRYIFKWLVVYCHVSLQGSTPPIKQPKESSRAESFDLVLLKGFHLASSFLSRRDRCCSSLWHMCGFANQVETSSTGKFDLSVTYLRKSWHLGIPVGGVCWPMMNYLMPIFVWLLVPTWECPAHKPLIKKSEN